MGSGTQWRTVRSESTLATQEFSPSVCKGSEHGRDKTDFRLRESGGMRDPPPQRAKQKHRSG